MEEIPDEVAAELNAFLKVDSRDAANGPQPK